ncbi:hypothetical protein C7457_0478 [Thermovibrio guaymasensis]|uniref:Uncharacterized protein n=1 Tax=Thermovibrio guaymasensis TaxID=240167 RepID=A0A420W8H2_9BACT|nr:hypothetical protein [Thermovibrio guaymasensis]RKQ63604.1 hypothetical protein C7457_0478 [Thermovibrio guaymasensis]
MSKSINEDIKAGKSVYHIQTEYYKSSGKIVTTIFKDGRSVKRLEKEVSDVSEEELNQEIEKFHRYVLDRLRGLKKKEVPALSSSERKFSVPQELYERLLIEISPFFGIASAFVLDEAIESASDVSSFIEALTSDLSEDQKELLVSKVKPLIEDQVSVSKEEVTEDEEKFNLTPELEEKILSILSEYFGIMASSVFEDSVKEWELTGRSYEELVDVISSHGDTEEEREEIRNRLMFLQT